MATNIEFIPRDVNTDEFKVPGFMRSKLNGVVVLMTEYIKGRESLKTGEISEGTIKGIVVKAGRDDSGFSINRVGDSIHWSVNYVERIAGRMILDLE